jgi:prepilin peptidase CpaA
LQAAQWHWLSRRKQGEMNSVVWWATVSLVLVAAVWDVRTRRIPNRLVLPFLVAGLAFSAGRHGMAGFARSIEGIGLAVVAVGVLCWLRGMGMGDLKLCAAVGAWIGFTQLAVALVITAMAGGVMAIVWAARHGALEESFDGAADLAFGAVRRGFRPHPVLTLDHPRARGIPYAPAIAVGALFSFFC